MKFNLIAAVVTTSACCANAAFAGDIVEPTDVGSTTMPAGEYTMLHKASNKAYTLMVTTKGSMIMSPAVSAAASATPAVPATPAVVAPAATAAAAVVTPAASATPVVGAPAAVAPTTSATGLLGNGAVKGLLNKGVKTGVEELIKTGAQNKLNEFLK